MRRKNLLHEKKQKLKIHNKIRSGVLNQMRTRFKKYAKQDVDKKKMAQIREKIAKYREDFRSFRLLGVKIIDLKQNFMDKEFAMFVKVMECDFQCKELKEKMKKKEEDLLKMSKFVDSVKRDPIGAIWNIEKLSAESIRKAELMFEKVQILEKENMELRKKNHELQNKQIEKSG